MAKSAIHEVGKQFVIAERFAARGNSLSEMRAVLLIAMATMEHQSPQLLTISDVATALEMSISGTSRMLSHLTREDFPLISSEKGFMGAKVELFFLSNIGRQFLEDILTFIRYGKNMKDMFSFDLSSFAQAKYVDRQGYKHAEMTSFDPETLIMKTAPIDHSLLEEIKQWVKDQDRTFVDIEQVKDGVEFKFSERAFAIIFRMRWSVRQI